MCAVYLCVRACMYVCMSPDVCVHACVTLCLFVCAWVCVRVRVYYVCESSLVCVCVIAEFKNRKPSETGFTYQGIRGDE